MKIQKDIKIAKSKKLKENLIKRLALNNEKIKSIIKSIKIIANFKDPVDVDKNRNLEKTKWFKNKKSIYSNWNYWCNL